MTAREVDELSVLLGEIKARLTVIEEQQREERQSAQQHRTGISLTIQAQATATAALTAKVEKLSDQVGEMKPLTEEFRTSRDQAKGAAKVVLAFRALILFVAAIVGAILTWLGFRH